MIDVLQQHYELRQAAMPSKHREKAMHAFLAQGLPTQRHEHWRYTSLRLLQNRGAPIQAPGVVQAKTALEQYAAKLVFVDGVFDAQQSEIHHAGVSVSTTEQGQSSIKPQEHPLAHLSMALAPSTWALNIAAHQVIEQPIEMVMICTQAFTDASTHMDHHVVIEKSSKATVLVRYISDADTAYWCNITRHISLKSNAQLTWHILQQHNASAAHTEVLKVLPGRDAQFAVYALSLGAKLARFDMDVHYQHSGAHCALVGAYHVNGSQLVDFHMNATHAVGHCTTEQWVRGIADGKSRAVFNGRVRIEKHASGSSSTQTNHNLLLSDQAEIDTKPELEIDHDDVQCKHGATVGQLDANALFYLQARGLPLEEAKALLQYAFMQQMIDRIAHEAIRECMETALMGDFQYARS